MYIIGLSIKKYFLYMYILDRNTHKQVKKMTGFNDV